MSIKINTGDSGNSVGRGDVYAIAPSDLVINLSKNTRAVSDAAVAAMETDIEARGQLQPVLGRLLPDKRVELYSGFHRALAGLRIQQRDPSFRLKVIVTAGVNEEDAFFASVRENALRNDLTPVDVANQVRRMQDQYGKSLDEIAAFYGKTRPWVSNHVKLLSLSKSIQNKVAAGGLTFQAALQLASLGEDGADEAVAAAETAAGADGNGKPETRKQASKRAKEAARARGAKVSRTVADLRRVLKGREDELTKAILTFFAGKGKEKDLVKTLDKVMEAAECVFLETK